MAYSKQLGILPLFAGDILKGATLIESVFGGLTPQQKSDIRVRRVGQLLTCARLGMLEAAQILLYLTTSSAWSQYPTAVQTAQRAFSSLPASMQQAASAAGGVPDNRHSGYCPEDDKIDAGWAPGQPVPSTSYPPLPTVFTSSATGAAVTTTTPGVAGGGGFMASGLGGGAGVLVLGAALVAALALSGRKGRG